MKTLSLVLASVLTSAAFAAPKAKTVLESQTISVVDLRKANTQKAKTQTVNLVDEAVDYSLPLLVKLPAEANAPKVVLNDANSSQCIDSTVTIRHNPLLTYSGTLVFIETDFNSDDGANVCSFDVTLDSGKIIKLELGFNIQD